MKKITIIILLILLSVSSCSNNLLTNHSTKTKDGLVNVVIEIPSGTIEKWEVKKPDGKLLWQYEDGKPRIVKYLPYPFNYGMIPQTLLSKENGGDGDPLDAIVIGDSIKRGKVVSGKVIGVLKMLDKGEQDDKIIIISKTSPLYCVNSIDELNQKFEGVSKIIETWFKNYKGKNKIKTNGFRNQEEANEIIRKSIKNHNLHSVSKNKHFSYF